MKNALKILGLVALALLIALPANATVWTLTDVNSTVKVDTGSQSGMFNWTVDGTNIMYQQWFWYRVGNNPEAPIDTLGLISENLVAPNILVASFGSTTGLEIQITYLLVGGTLGSQVSDVAETIRIHNHFATPLDLHFFQYSDFDLNQVNRVDTVRIDPSRRFVNQNPWPSSTGPILSETVMTGSATPSHVEAASYPSTRNKLNDGAANNLNDVYAAGPGDVTWAFQWDTLIAARGSFLISKDKTLAPVPEPATLALLGGVLVMLARRLRRNSV